MKSAADFVPTKKHDGYECGLHKECHDALDGQWCTEYIAHKPRVIAPVCTELKLEYQSRGHTYGKVYSKEFHPELGGTTPMFVTLDIIERLHDAHYQCQA